MRKFLSLLVALVLLCTALPVAFAQEDAVQATLEDIGDIRTSYDVSAIATAEEIADAQALLQVTSMEEVEVPMYFLFSNVVEAQKILLFNGNKSVAYMEIDELFGLLKQFMATDPGYSLTTAYGDQCYLAMRENYDYAMVDFASGAVFFSDYDMFGVSASAVSGGDILASFAWQTNEDGSIKTDADGQELVHLFSRVDTDKNFTRYGYSLGIQLAQNHIPVYWVDGKGYMPVTTFADVFLPNLSLSFLFNGEAVFLVRSTGFDDTVTDDDGKTLKDIIYEGAKVRTKELAEYTYWEMVMLLEGNYGLRDEHQVGDDFDTYLASIGLKDRLLSQDGVEFSDALLELMMGYFGDLHSGVSEGSPYAGVDYVVDYINKSNLSGSVAATIKDQARYSLARKDSACVDEDGVAIPYLEVGDTAYITFDHFAMDSSADYYDPAVVENLDLCNDNIALIHYANEQITRDDSPIKNVVLDLSLNGGGAADAAYFVISWVLGTCHFSTVNPISKAQYTVGYQSDVNLDGYITEEDSLDLSKVKVFCLTSSSSFSCGNLTPAAFKESGVVTLLGQTSGGGACVVGQTIAADGTVYQYSSRYRLSTVKNGSYYSIDQGVVPDFTITDPAHLYDRAWLTAYIAQLP